MSQAIVEAVRVNFPTPLGAEHGRCLLAIASALGGGAGLLLKDYGTYVVLPGLFLPNGEPVKVSQDIICYPNGRIFDCLADGEGAADPAWTEAHGSPIDDLSRYYAVSAAPAPEPQPIPQPQPVPPACKANDAAAEVLDALHEMRLENAERYDALRSQLHRLEVAAARARKVRGKVSWSGQIDGEVSGVPV